MKKQMFHALLLFLAVLMCFSPLLTACAGNTQTNENDSENQADDTPFSSSESEKTTDTLDPEDTSVVIGEGQIDLFGDNKYGYGVGIPEMVEANNMLNGSCWPDHVSKDLISYSGYLDKQMECEADAVREIVTTTLSDGSEGKAIRLANDGTKDYSGAGNFICGFNALEPNKTYTLIVTLKYTAAPGDAANGALRDVYLSCNQDKNERRVYVQADGEWKTYYYQFTTYPSLEGATQFHLGADGGSPFLNAGFEILYEKLQLIGDIPSDTAQNVLTADIKEVDYSGFGLQVDENGVIMLNGKPFYGMGVNFHGPVSMRLGDDQCDLDIYFKKLEDAHIPYCRVMFGVFYDHEVKQYVSEQTHDKFIAALDYVVGMAEKHNVGLIASLFWSKDAFMKYCGETFEKLADPESETIRLQKQYIHEIVGRYKYSPAIWAWEIGNEGNLDCEILHFENEEGADTLFTTEILNEYYKILGAALREEDPYRMITGGDSAPRDSSASLRKYHSWSPVNTYDDYKNALSWYTPEPLDTVSLHYPALEQIDDYVKMAKELKIGLFVGEFHGTFFDNPLDALSPDESPEEALEQSSWYALRDAYIANGVQLATAWCYGRYIQQSFDGTSIEVGMVDGIYQNVYQYEGLKEANERYISEGKNDAANYWASVPMAIHQ